MRMRRLSRLITMLAIVLVLAACAGAVSPATALPLTQTFQSGDGTVTLKHPDGWIAQDLLGQVTVANGQAALDAASPAPGQFQARLFTTPVSAIAGLSAEAAPRDVLQFFAESLSTSGVTFSAPTDLTIGTRAAARIEGSGTDGQGVVLALNVGDNNYAFVSAISAPGEMNRFEPTLLAILDSLVYTPLVIPVPEATP